MTPKRAINLARVSTPQQAKLYSLDYQLQQMRQYDEDMGLVIVAEFRDDVSGRKLERDGLENACQMLEQNEADVLVTWKFDRLHRNYVNSVLLRDRIRRAGKEIHYAQSRTVSGRTARERLPEDLQFIMAEIDADDIADRTNTGKRNKIEQGNKWLGLNRPPFGYVKEGRGKEGKLVIHPDYELIVQNIFTWYVYGDKAGVPLSVQEIADKLTALHIATPEDLLPKRRQKKRGFAEWASSSISKMLRDTTYSGVFYQYRYRRVNGRVEKVTDKSLWRGVPVPVIIGQELFDAAQTKLDGGRKYSPRATRFQYLVGRRIQCECGYTMRSSASHRIHGDKEYNYLRYICLGRDKFVVGNCDMPSLVAEQVDDRVWQYIKEEIANPTNLERKLREIQAGQQQANSGKQETLDRLYAHKSTIEAELERLAKLYGHPSMPTHITDKLIGEENHKLQLTLAEIRKTEDEVATPLTDDVVISLVAFSKNFHERLEAVGTTFVGRRTVIDGLDVRVVALRRGEEMWLRITSILRPEGQELPLKSSPTDSTIFACCR